MQIKITMEKKSCLFSYFEETSMSTHIINCKKSARKSTSARIREAKFFNKKKGEEKIIHENLYTHTYFLCCSLIFPLLPRFTLDTFSIGRRFSRKRKYSYSHMKWKALSHYSTHSLCFT